VMSAESQ